jgi:hypothetical protein
MDGGDLGEMITTTVGHSNLLHMRRSETMRRWGDNNRTIISIKGITTPAVEIRLDLMIIMALEAVIITVKEIMISDVRIAAAALISSKEQAQKVDHLVNSLPRDIALKDQIARLGTKSPRVKDLKNLEITTLHHIIMGEPILTDQLALRSQMMILDVESLHQNS